MTIKHVSFDGQVDEINGEGKLTWKVQSLAHFQISCALNRKQATNNCMLLGEDEVQGLVSEVHWSGGG